MIILFEGEREEQSIDVLFQPCCPLPPIIMAYIALPTHELAPPVFLMFYNAVNIDSKTRCCLTDRLL
jgi:hypothetical protein